MTWASTSLFGSIEASIAPI